MIKTLKYLEALLALLTFILFVILPQINVAEYVQATITSKLIYFIYSCIVLFSFYLLARLISKKVVFVISKLDISLLVLITYITVNRYFIQLHFGFSIRYMELLGLCVLYVVLRSLSVKYCFWLLLAIVISSIIQAIYGNLQLLGYYASNHSAFKMTGSFFNPGPYAGFLVSIWPLALGMYLFKDEITAQVKSQTKNDHALFHTFIKQAFEYIPLLGIICIAIVLPATQSRASWVAAIVGSIILVELRYSLLSNLFKKATARLQKTVLVLILVGILSAVFFSTYHHKKESSDGRAFIWKVTTEMIADVPVFGVGFDRFKAHFMNYQAHYFGKNGETSDGKVADNTCYAFNEFLQFISENGLVGFLFLMITVLVLFKVKEKENYKCLYLVGKAGLFSIGIFACFSYPMQILPIKLVLVFLVAMLSSSSADSYQLKMVEKRKKLLVLKTAVAILVVFCICKTISFTKSLSKGFIIWESALRSHQYGDYQEAVTAYESVYGIFKEDGDFLMNYGKTLSMGGKSHEAIVVLEQARHYQNNTVIETALGDSYKTIKQYNKAETAYQEAINMTPSKFYSSYLLAKLYDTSGQEEKAVAVAKKLINKEVKVPSTAIKEIRGEMKKILLKYKNPPGFKN